MTFCNVQLQRPVVFLNHDGGVVTGTLSAVQPTGDSLQAFQAPHAGVGAFKHPFRIGVQHQGFHDIGFEAFGAG